MEAKLNDLVTDDQGGVVGVIYTKNGETTKLFADAVILATGGHSRSSALLKEFSPEIASFASTNGGFATGDGVVAARKIGADLALMDKVQLHPTGLVDPKDPNNPTKFLGPEALRAAGGILLNQEGKRFTVRSPSCTPKVYCCASYSN
jgi:succinate dehydrogenase/fumarate reductase flavoprotein subunit